MIVKLLDIYHPSGWVKDKDKLVGRYFIVKSLRKNLSSPGCSVLEGWLIGDTNAPRTPYFIGWAKVKTNLTKKEVRKLVGKLL